MNPDNGIVFELLAHNELKKFQGFVKDYWEEGHLFGRETSIFDWQHKGPDAYHFMVAKQRGALVGVQGIIPQSQFDNRLPRIQIFLSRWKVLEDKGICIGLRLYKNILKEYMPEFIGSIGLRPHMIQYHVWQGFKVGKMDHHAALSPFIDKFKIAKVPEDIKPRSIKNRFAVSFLKLTEKDLQGLNTKDLYLYQWPLKSDTYIKNRYMDHPIYTYEVYAIFKDRELQALCVIRPILREGAVVLRFVDFIGPNEAFPLLHDFISYLLKRHNAEYLDIYSNGIPSELIQEAGFIEREKIKDLIIPNYFEPFERKNIDEIFAYKCSQTHPAIRLFKGDSDRDRPNQIQGRG